MRRGVPGRILTLPAPGIRHLMPVPGTGYRVPLWSNVEEAGARAAVGVSLLP
ncbi:hypothetical protein SCAB_52341 [Streptomyces scabiei 87.22]|uniref:Uncharacterized protein n=1 Tax=Streptomyces scabiei (strain 87.22) TaxID=680198 RepID=C9YV73_STRSW|nr:hypothetical protein SCAB_52341 [Streptomyces scabiei 87.22]